MSEDLSVEAIVTEEKTSGLKLERPPSKEWLEDSIDKLTIAIKQGDVEQTYRLAESLQGYKVDVYHEAPQYFFPLLKKTGRIEASKKDTSQYLGRMVYFGVEEPYGWVQLSPNEEPYVDVVLVKDVPLKFTLPVKIGSWLGPSQLGIPVREVSFVNLKRNSALENRFSEIETDQETEEVLYEHSYHVWEAEGAELTDKVFRQISTGRWLSYGKGPFGTTAGLSSDQIAELDKYLKVTKVEKAFDPDLGKPGVPNGVYYDRVYVEEDNPLLACSVAAAVGAVEVVWGQPEEELKPAEKLNLLKEGEVDALVDQIVHYYSTEDSIHGRKHIREVLINLDLLAEDEHVDLRTLQLAKLAVAGHDVVRGGYHPAEDSAEVMKNNLRDLLSEEEIKLVIDAIIQHNKAPEDRFNESMVTKLLVDADKLDWTLKRYGIEGKDDELFDQFRDETEMILGRVYFNRTKRHLADLAGVDFPVESSEDSDRYDELANQVRKIKGYKGRERWPDY